MCRSGGNRFSIRLTWPARVSGLLSLFLLLIPAAWAQLPQGGDTTSPPTPGVGHDYIHSPVETVNPANGSVSIRIPVRVPSGRELTIPFSIAYDSSGAFYVGEVGGAGQPGLIPPAKPSSTPFFSEGGWSYAIPLLSGSSESWTVQSPDGKNLNCVERTNYVFQDPTGNRHNMGLATIDPFSWVQYCGGTSQDILQGSEGPLLFTTPGYSGGVTVTDGNGTVYSFSSLGVALGPPTSITDRNGNSESISYNLTTPSVSVTDTTGRTAVSVSTFGSNPDNISVAGITSPYKVYWTTASANFTDDMTDLGSGGSGDGGCPTSMTGSANVASQVVLPNGQKYTFTYDPTYGMLTKIVYPSGGYVRYVWGVNHQAEALSWVYPNPNGVGWSYDCLYGFPAITDRYVSFDGSTEALHQHFAYSTTWPSGSEYWTSKETTVTTTDLIRGTSFNTVYTYSAVPAPSVPELNPNDVRPELTVQVPVEQTIQYDGTNGSPLKTVGKTWCNGDPRELCSEATTLNDTGQVSEATYAYNTSEQQTERDEYDYGSGRPGALTRKTVTNYASFTGAHIVDLPSSVITCTGAGTDSACNGVGTRVAETDSSYDQTGLQSTSVVQHVAAGSARGNLTTVTKQCFNGACAGGNPTTTYSYYDTGQIYQMTDPCGNGTCSDMTGTSHTTTFSYTDSYSSCGGNAPPSGATNAYLTQVTYPKTGTINHIESHCYDYTAGLLRGSTDENGQTSSFTYADSLDRLTEASYPDGGQTLISYNDYPPTPSVTTEKKLDSTGRFVTSVSITDGIGLPIEAELTSDPQGTDYTVTGYDGLGRAYTVTNPYRSGSDPTYGTTYSYYDALGRTTSVVKPDGSSSTVTTTYSGNCTTVTDEAGKNRESCTDGLGRMTSVIENPGGLGYTTNYTYDTLDDLTGVSQGGSRSRSFNYDSLKRLTSSTNPEAGTVTYAYDLDGNVSTKKDARSITTTYAYDALNRVSGMTYSNGDTTVGYTYDQSACLGQPSCYNIGHRTRIDDAGGAEEFAYDKMGREIAEERWTGGLSKSTAYAYDLAGDMTSLTYPSTRTITYTYDSAGRPSEAQDVPNSINYVVGSCANGLSSNGVCYAPNGSVAQIQNGTNLVSTYLYNTRFQPCWMYATTGTALATNTSCTASGSGTHATGTVSISGVEQKKCSTSSPVKATSPTVALAGCPIGEGYIYDSGDVSITVDGFVADAGYGQGSTASNIANSLISQLNASNSPVTASGGTTITLTSKATGTSANYPLSTSVSWDDGDFSSPSFRATPSGSMLTGGSGFASGNILDLQYNFNLGAGDNGNVVGITNNRDTTRTQSLTYDQLNRLATAQTQGTSGPDCFGFQFTYDAWTNLTATSILNGYTSCSQTTPYAFSLSVNGGNQITTSGFGYDTSGNLSSDGVNNYAWNAESEVKSVAGFTYTYDGDGNRLEKSSGKIYWYGAGTEILDESDTSGNFTNEYVFFGGKRVAMRTVSSGAIYYYEDDMLGSARTMVQAGQTTSCFDADFLPYGQEVDFISTCGSNYRFEGKERDLETGNDNFGARYYRSALGRWLSADWSSVPAPVPYANLTNPQTLNLYAMVSDNPETFADLDGHQCGLIGSSDRNSCPKPEQSSSDAKQGEGFNSGDGTQKSDSQRAQQQNQQPGSEQSTSGKILNYLKNNALHCGGSNVCTGGLPGPLGAEEAAGEIAGAVSKSEKVAALTKEAEAAYPKLAAKAADELHHVVPKYLGGAANGETVALRPAYHQLITNEFRRLAPYGQQIERSAQEVGRIIEQVYTKYPLP